MSSFQSPIWCRERSLLRKSPARPLYAYAFGLSIVLKPDARLAHSVKIQLGVSQIDTGRRGLVRGQDGDAAECGVRGVEEGRARERAEPGRARGGAVPMRESERA